MDRRSVVNPPQALALLYAVCAVAPWLVAFFACLYFAGLRPAEAVHMRVTNCDLPDDDGPGARSVSPDRRPTWGSGGVTTRARCEKIEN